MDGLTDLAGGRLFIGDVLDGLSRLPDESVNCCVTSPPYWGLRDYGADGQFGMEATPEEFVANMVAVFREVRRVLRSDGTLWLNIGDSYARAGGEGNPGPNAVVGNTVSRCQRRQSGAMTNISDSLHCLLKGRVLFYGSADPRRVSAESIHVLIYDERSPDDLVFEPLLRAKRVSIKDGQDDLCQVGGALNPPVTCWVARSLGGRFPEYADSEGRIYLPKNLSVVVAAGELNADPSLGNAPSFAIEDRQASFSVEITGEPVPEGVAGRVPILDAFTIHSLPEGISNVDSVDETVALADGLDTDARQAGDFRIRVALQEKLSLVLKGGSHLSFRGVSHLNILGGGVTPYCNAYATAIKRTNALQSKQELGIPDMVKRAMMEDGWICRQTIIWAKPNPMPEPVRDRCTKSHEYLFLLSKSGKYRFDCDAIKEKAVGGTPGNKTHKGKTAYEAGDQFMRTKVGLTNMTAATERNKRSVWRVATKSYRGAHFATFPPRLIEPCILAGCPEGGIVLDPFMGSGTTAQVAVEHRRKWVGCELNPKNEALIRERLAKVQPCLV